MTKSDSLTYDFPANLDTVEYLSAIVPHFHEILLWIIMGSDRRRLSSFEHFLLGINVIAKKVIVVSSGLAVVTVQ